MGSTPWASGEIRQGDCLDLAPLVKPESVRLILVDPPFNTGRTRQGKLKESGTPAEYADEWPTRDDYVNWLEARVRAMATCLIPGGSLVLHCPPEVSHVIRLMLEKVFGDDAFVNEIIWHYTGGGRSRSRFSSKHDSLLWFAPCGRGGSYTFQPARIREAYAQSSGYARGGIKSGSGKLYQPHPDGKLPDDVWQIPIVNPLASERVGYPTQKPLALYERLVLALSDPGDLVADFFCGSGTSLVAAARHGRTWLGCDLSEVAVTTTRRRLAEVTAAYNPSRERDRA